MNQTQILRSLMESMHEASRPKTSAYDTTATVRRIEDGVAWVHIPGGVDETPVKLTVNAKAGDTVQVRVSGGTAFLVGNGTSPPTDDTTAIAAKETADGAVERASSASEEAERAKKSADIAASAADSAQRSADNAGEYAARALGNLSTVQSVAETLTWITQHGTMTLTTDTELDPTHVYFVQDANGDYVVGNTHYSIVKEPSADDLASYYVLSIDESLQNYVGTHLALTGEGLWILPETNGYKVLVATGGGTQYTTAGTYIIDAGGDTVAMFGADGAMIGKRRQTNIQIAPSYAVMHAVDGSTALKTTFEGVRTGDGDVKYGVRITDPNNRSFITITPVTEATDDGIVFNKKLRYHSEMYEYSYYVGEGSLRIDKRGVIIQGTNSDDYCLINWNGTIKTADGFSSLATADALNNPPLFWKTGTATGTLSSDNQWLNTTFAFPSKAGYSRHIIRTSVNTSGAVVTGYSVENETNYVSFRMHRFSGSDVSVTVTFVAAYLKDSLQW
jgi:hypothetical protein